MEIRTGVLSAPEIRGELAPIVAWLIERGLANVDVMYGWNCDNADSQYEPTPMATESLQRFVERGVEAGYFQYGGCDLWIASQALAGENIPKAQFCLCHEADIHFASPEGDFVDTVKANWLAKGWTVYQGTGEPGCEWKKSP
jgi:hypothetical protein